MPLHIAFITWTSSWNDLNTIDESLKYNNINTYQAMGKFSWQQTDESFLIFPRK